MYDYLTNAQELSSADQAIKARTIELIGDYFKQHPTPVNNIESDAEHQNYLCLLDYSVVTMKESESYIVELCADGFSYEGPYGDRATDVYDVLSTAELIDLLQVLEDELVEVSY